MKLADTMCSMSELAEVVGVTRQYIGQLRKENEDFPKQRGEKFSLGEFARWYVEYLKKRGDSSKNELLIAETRKLQAQAELAHIKLAQEQERLITVDEANDTLAEGLMEMKSQLQALPTKLAPQVVVAKTAREAEDIILQYVDDLLNDLATIPERVRALAEQEQGEKSTEGTEV